MKRMEREQFHGLIKDERCRVIRDCRDPRATRDEGRGCGYRGRVEVLKKDGYILQLRCPICGRLWKGKWQKND